MHQIKNNMYQIKDLAKNSVGTNICSEGALMSSTANVPPDTIKGYLEAIDYKIGDLMMMLGRLEEIDNYLLGVAEREPKADIASNAKNNQSVIERLAYLNYRLGTVCQAFDFKLNGIKAVLG